MDYIACQGPTEETIPDFFQMIWDQNSPIIVMLTREVEGKRVIKKLFYSSFSRSNVQDIGRIK